MDSYDIAHEKLRVHADPSTAALQLIALRKENARYRAALEAIVDGMWIDQTSRETLYQSTQDACQLADRALKGEAADVLDRIVEEDTL